MSAIPVGLAMIATFCALMIFFGRRVPDKSQEEVDRLMQQFLKMSHDADPVTRKKSGDDQARRSPPNPPKG